MPVDLTIPCATLIVLGVVVDIALVIYLLLKSRHLRALREGRRCREASS